MLTESIRPRSLSATGTRQSDYHFEDIFTLGSGNAAHHNIDTRYEIGKHARDQFPSVMTYTAQQISGIKLAETALFNLLREIGDIESILHHSSAPGASLR